MSNIYRGEEARGKIKDCYTFLQGVNALC